ncbi:MAG: hypothetical protein ABJL44_13320 [Algibacter sp.]
MGFEVWALQAGVADGMVAHYNIRIGNGPVQHVYRNICGVVEIVPLNGRPTGY